jgi:predicted TPR repeat methyltransferase
MLVGFVVTAHASQRRTGVQPTQAGAAVSEGKASGRNIVPALETSRFEHGSHPRTFGVTTRTNPPMAPLQAFQNAILLHQQGRLGEAERLYRTVLKTEPCHSGALHHLGVIHAQQGKLEDAIELIRRSLMNDSQSTEAWSDLGVALETANRHAEAVQCYEKAIALRPDYTEAHYNLGNALQALERHDEAIARFRSALEVRSNHTEAHNNLGRSLHALGRFAEAVTHFKQALVFEPSFAEVENNLGTALQALERHAEAILHFERALRIKPNFAQAHVNLGISLCVLDRNLEALDHVQRSLALNPDSAATYHSLGTMFQKLKRYEEAIGSYQRAIALKSDYALAHFSLGTALHFRGRIAEAVEHFKTAIALQPDYPGNAIAQHLCAAYFGEQVPLRASDEYVRKSFDELAESFDAHLKKLDYRAPQLLMDAVEREIGIPSGSLGVLDAGCGTGLCGSLLRPFARRLIGVDLSEGMIAKARERDVYDELVVGELTAFLREKSQAYDLILSADTLVYFGDLGQIASAAAAALLPGGVIAFSLERLDADGAAPGYRLEKHGRYTHTEQYIRKIMTRVGAAIVSLERAVPRIERGAPVAGLLVVARK